MVNGLFEALESAHRAAEERKYAKDRDPTKKRKRRKNQGLNGPEIY